ncbi:MAG: hypothetical protein IPI93_12940 [Sphingobacteriaceae bacterium]|nr:hypothetical protein [Sphingobacteriaceae bacterium]
MIAYNKILLSNMLIVKKAKQWFSRDLISGAQMASILNKYPIEYFKPNIFIKVGLFLFTLFLIGAALGLFSLMSMGILVNNDSFEGYSIFVSIIFGGACVFFLEKFIQWRNWYSNGIDDALLYSALSFIFSAIAFSISNDLNDEDGFLLMCFIYLPFLMVAAARYIDRVVTIFMIACMYCIFFSLIMKIGNAAKFIMPFAFMGLSAAFYFIVKKQMTFSSRTHYKGCFKVIKAISLIVFYVSGNYYVIRESSVEFFNLDLSEGQDIPMALIFYAFTAFVPLLYLFFGLRTKDKLLVWVSLLLIAVSALTFKYYFSLGHPEVSLTIAGLVMMALAYVSIKYLVTDKKGITFKDDPNEDNFLKANAEALVIAQSFGTHAQPTDTGVQMGGGEFGGGGSGNKF